LGQKVHPIGFRLGIVRTWSSKWYSEADYSKLLHEDIKLRDYLKKRLYHAGISKIEIERAASKAKLNIFAARPGIIIGKKGAEVEALKKSWPNSPTKKFSLIYRKSVSLRWTLSWWPKMSPCNLSGV
jgi:ribosomal protein S3